MKSYFYLKTGNAPNESVSHSQIKGLSKIRNEKKYLRRFRTGNDGCTCAFLSFADPHDDCLLITRFSVFKRPACFSIMNIKILVKSFIY